MTRQPNLLLVATDTQRWDTLNCMGSPYFGQTPDTFDIIIDQADYSEYIPKHGFTSQDCHKQPTPVPEEHFLDTFFAKQTIEQIDKVVNSDSGPFFAFCSFPAPHPPECPPGDWLTFYDNCDNLPDLNYTEREEQNQPTHTKRPGIHHRSPSHCPTHPSNARHRCRTAPQ